MAGEGSRGGCGGGALTRLPGNILVFRLIERRTVTAVTVSDTAWDQMVISGPEFARIGPATQDIVLNIELHNTTGLFECRVALQGRFMDGDWVPAPASIATADLLTGASPIAADGLTVTVPFTDRQRLARIESRLLLQFHAKATGGGVVGAKSEISISGIARPFCC